MIQDISFMPVSKTLMAVSKTERRHVSSFSCKAAMSQVDLRIETVKLEWRALLGSWKQSAR